MSTPRSRTLVVVLALGVLALAACGGGAAGTGTGTDVTSGGGGNTATVPPASSDPAPTTAPTTAAPTTTTTLGSVTRADPLRVLLVGDSLAWSVGRGFADLEAGGVAIDLHELRHGASGLSRPDFYDWPAAVHDVGPSIAPDIVVVVLGANDGQSFKGSDGVVYRRGTPAWKAEYGRRVATFMDELRSFAPDVYWVELPPMRPADLRERLAPIPAIVERAAAGREHVRVVDLDPVLSDGAGGFAESVTGPDGVLRVREPDGVHLTVAGGELVARAVLAATRASWGPVPGL